MKLTEQQQEQIIELARECEQSRAYALACQASGNFYGESGNYRIMRDASAEAFRIAQEAAHNG